MDPSKISSKHIKQYQALLTQRGVSESTIKRNLSSLRKFSGWLTSQNYLKKDPLAISPRRSPFGHLQGVRLAPKVAFQAQRALPYFTYLNFIILAVFLTALGWGLYQQFVVRAPSPLAYPEEGVGPKRYLSFQGRLTDSGYTPIFDPVTMRFYLYDDPGSGSPLTGGTLLWDSDDCTVDPDDDGIFAILLGTTSGDGYTCTSATEIPSHVFSENAEVWLHIKVGSEDLEPRIQIATVAYALNTETLQGFPLASAGNITPEATMGATARTVPAINPAGNLVIASDSPTIWSTSGTFGIKGQAITIQTDTGTGGNITLAPDGTGVINIVPTSGNQIGGTINATNSALTTGALYTGRVENENTGFDFLRFFGGVSPTERFSVGALGSVYMANNLDVGGAATITGTLAANGAIISNLVPSGTRNLGSSGSNWDYLYVNNIDAFTLQGAVTGNNQNITGLEQLTVNNLRLDGNTLDSTSGNLTLLSAGELYFDDTRTSAIPFSVSDTALNAALAQGIIDAINDAYDAAIGSGGISGFWTKTSGLIFPNNTYESVAVGGTATSSAKLYFEGTTGNASMSGQLTLNASGTNYINALSGQALSLRTSVGGDAELTDRLYISNSGNVGIGTTSPTEKLTIDNGNVSIQGEELLSEGFEDVTFPPTSWTTGGDVSWARDTGTKYAGSASAASGTITHRQSSWLDRDYTFSEAGNINFYWKVSSEGNWDFLIFCLDNDSCTRDSGYNRRISGTVDWTFVTVPVSAGSHSFRWLYGKDGSGSTGSDKGWVDNVVFETKGNLFTASTVGIGTASANFALDVASGDINTTTLYRIGGETVLQTPGYSNIFVGKNAGYSNSGLSNAAIGTSALFSNTTGSTNTAIGTSALFSNTTGTANTAIGTSALFSNTTGSTNTAIGNGTLYKTKPTSKAITAFADSGTDPGVKTTVTSASHGQSNDTVVQISGTTNYNGSWTISNVATDTFDIIEVFVADDATGWWSILSEGRYNTALGYLAGFNNVTGSSNVFLGYKAGYTETGSNRLYIANDTGTPLIYGNFSIGYVGLGTTTPLAALHIDKNTSVNPALIINQLGSGNIIEASSSGTRRFFVTTGGSLNASGYATISGSLAMGYSSVLAGTGNAAFAGKVGIGTTNPGYSLEVSGGNAQFDNIVYFANGTTYYVDASGHTNLNNITGAGALDINGGDTHDIAGTLNLSGDALTSTGDLTITPAGGDLLLAGNFLPSSGDTYDLGTTTAYWDNLYVNNIYGGGSGTQGFWSKASGVIYPNNAYESIAVGGISTTSAQLYFEGTTGNASMSGNLALAGGGTIGATDMNNLTIGDTSTQNVIINPNGSVYFQGSTYYIDSSALAYLDGLATTGYTPTSGEIRANVFRDGNSGYYLQPADTGIAGVFAGKVGIGTTDPSTNLDIAGNATISGTLALGPQTEAYAGICDATAEGKMYYDGSASKYYYCNGSSWTEMGAGGGGLWTDQSGYIDPTTITSGSFRIYDNSGLAIGYASDPGQDNVIISGNVGIGTTSPGAKLDIVDNVVTSGKILSLSSTSIDGGDVLYLANNSGNSAYLIRAQAGASLSNRLTLDSSGNLKIYDTDGTNSLNLSHDGTNAVITSSAGNVEIGSGGGDFLIGENGTAVDIHFDESGNIEASAGKVITITDIGNITPDATKTYNLGSSTLLWDNLYANNATLSGTLALGPQTEAYAGTCDAEAEGKMYYDNAQDAYYYCDGSTWTEMGGGAAGLWEDGTYGIYENDKAVIVGADAAFSWADGGVGDLKVADQLEVVGDASVSGTLTFYGSSPTIATTNMRNLTLGSADTGKILIHADTPLQINSNDILDSGGNTRITLGSLVQVSGNFQVTGNTTFGDGSGDTVTSNAGAWTFANATTLNLVDSQAQALNIESGLLNLDTANSRVGIGTTVPSYKLDVWETKTNTSGYNYLTRNLLTVNPASDSTGEFTAQYNYVQTSGSSKIGVLTGLRNTISAGDTNRDKVYGTHNYITNGDGTTTDVYGTYNYLSGGEGAFENTYGLRIDIEGENLTNAYGVYIDNIDDSITDEYGIYQAGSDDDNYFAGDVGIGTTSPTGILDIEGASPILYINATGGTDPKLTLQDAGADEVHFWLDQDLGNLVIENDNSGKPIVFNTNNGNWNFYNQSTTTDVVVIEAGGNMGIGTTAPSARLDIVGDLEVNGYATVSASLAVGYAGGIAGPGNAIFQGNVGIGTTAPGAALDVVGNILVQGGGTIDTRATGTLAIGGTTQTGLTLGRGGATTTIAGSGLTISPAAWTTTPTISGKVTMTGGLDSNAASTITNLTLDGNSGTALNISGTSFTTDLNLRNSDTINNTAAGTLAFSSSTFTASSLATLTTAAGVSWGGATSLTFTADNATIYGSDAASGNLTLQGTSNATKTTSYVMLQPTGGSVGIGTTAPGNQFEVYKNGGDAEIAIRTGASGGDPTLYYRTNSDYWGVWMDDSGGNLNFWNDDNRVVITPAGAVTIASSLTVNLGTAGTNYFVCSNVAGTGSQTLRDCSGDDYAEYFAAEAGLEPGDLLSASPATSPESSRPYKLTAAAKEYDSKLVGAVSTSGLVANEQLEPTDILVALVGKIPLKVSTLNGSIEVGDLITSSEISGVGMKATKAGPIIGKALESFDEAQGETCPNHPELKCGKILVSVNLGWYDPSAFITDAGELGGIEEINTNNYQLTDKAGETIDKFIYAGEALIANLRAGLIQTKALVADSLTVNQKLVSPVVETEQLTADTVNSKQVTADSLEAKESEFGKLLIKSQEGKTVASIDSSGNVKASSIEVDSAHVLNNASFGGMLEAESLDTEQVTSDQLSVTGDATVAGTLYAQEIVTEKGTFGELLARVENLESSLTESVPVSPTPTPSPEPTATPQPEAEAPTPTPTETPTATESGELELPPEATDSGLLEEANNWSLSDPSDDILLTSDITITGDLTSLGTTSLADTSVAGQLMVDATVIIDKDGIQTLPGSNLKLQAYGWGGIDMLDGKVTIDTQGNVLITGELTAGRITTGGLVLSERSDLKAGQTSLGEESGFGKLLSVINKEGIEVASIDASGSAFFAQLGIEADYTATQSGAIIAAADNYAQNGYLAPAIKTNATAGIGLLPANEEEVMIYNPQVTDESLIYVTATTNTENKVLYVKAKKVAVSQTEPGWFIVALNEALDKEIQFNWWIIN